MNAISQTESPPFENHHSESPGRLLQRGRTAKNLSVQEVAGQLRLHPQVITAIEADRFDSLAGPVFIQGYVKSYARLVGLDPDPIQVALQARMKGLEPRSATRFLRANRHHRFHDRQRMGLGLMRWGALLIGLLLLVYWWWQSPAVQKHLHTSSQALTEESSAPSLSNGLPLTSPFAARTPPEESGSYSPLSSSASPEPSLSTSTPPVTPIAVAPPVVKAPDPLSAKEPDTNTPATLHPEVVLEFSKHAWVSVKDASRKPLMSGDFSKGSRKVLQGTPPFQILIKHPSAVKVTVNSKPYDYSSFVNRGRAKFTLDPGKIP